MDARSGSNQLTRRSLLQIGGAMGAAVALASCSLGETSGAKGKSQLNFWLTPNASPEAMKSFTDDMAKGLSDLSKGDTSVASLVVPWENALTKYTAAFSGNNPPDVTYQIMPWMNKWRDTGVLADLRKFASKEELASFTEGQPKSYLDAATGPHGELFAVPFTQAFQPLTVNVAVWEKADKPDLPKTLEEMIGFAKAMTLDTKGRSLTDKGFDSKNIEHYGMSWPAVPANQENWMWQYFWDYGADSINEAKDDIGFDNPEGREALAFMKKFVASGAVTPPGLYADAARWDTATISGQTAMQWQTNLTEDMAKQFPDAQLKVVPLPSGPAGQFIVAGCGYWAMSAKSKDPKAAYQFTRFLLEPKQADRYIRTILGQPTRPVEGNYYSEPLPDPRMNTFLNEATGYAAHARANPILPFQPNELILGKINDYLFQGQSLDDMIKEASQGVKQMAK